MRTRSLPPSPVPNKRPSPDDASPSPSKRRAPPSDRPYTPPATPKKNQKAFSLAIPARQRATRTGTKVLSDATHETVLPERSANSSDTPSTASDDVNEREDSLFDVIPREVIEDQLEEDADSEGEDHLPNSPESSLPLAIDVNSRRIPSVFAHAASLLSLSSSTPPTLPLHGRETERATLQHFLSTRFPRLNSDLPATTPSKEPPRASLYICGPPGIGKTALLSSLLSGMKASIHEQGLEANIVVAMENCSSVGSLAMEAMFWQRLANGLAIDLPRNVSAQKARAAFEEAVSNSGRQYLVILDEIDHLLPSASSSRKASSASRDLLNAIFSMAHSIPNSSFTVIGIANALDLTARSLRLEAFGLSAEAGPQVLNFKPYPSETLEQIVKERLALLGTAFPLLSSTDENVIVERLSALPLVEPKALELCAKRVAKGTGDVRVMLNIVRRAIGFVERAELTKLLSSSSSEAPTSSPSRSPALLSHLTPSTAPKVSMKTMLEALRVANLSTPPALATQLASLNFDHRAALVGIVVAMARAAPPGVGFDVRNDTVVLESVAFAAYSDVLSREGTMSAKNSNAFRDALDALECAGLVRESRTPARARSGNGPSPPRKAVGSGKVLVLSEHSVADLVEGLRTTPSACCELEEGFAAKSAGAMQETLRISKNILDSEEDRFVRSRKQREKTVDSEVPMAGFHGDGLDEKTAYMGEVRH